MSEFTDLMQTVVRGDILLIENLSSDGKKSIFRLEKIKRVITLQIICESGYRYSRANGGQMLRAANSTRYFDTRTNSQFAPTIARLATKDEQDKYQFRKD